jgi:formate hydrogenlyase subunit 4
MVIARALDVLALLVMPFLLTGLITRVKSLWAGRRGAPLLQPAWDVLRLLRKTPVYSETTTPLFRVAPWVFLLTAVGAAWVVPVLGSAPLGAFRFDFVWFAYAWALGRVALMLAALDTGSPFEGMGSSREATFSALLEPVLFLALGALVLATGERTLAGALAPPAGGNGATFVAWLGAVAALVIVLQVEASRMPVDDPTTHLELTMVHEVMVLDHSGPDLAAIQYGSALKLYVAASLVATLFNPWAGTGSALGAAVNLGLCVVVAVLVGTVESLVARLRMRAVPRYIAVGLAAATVALLAHGWQPGVTP